nr:type II toxin-antitoxin system RelE/ParE family toxin [uncultured Arsenicibacter sp.]
MEIYFSAEAEEELDKIVTFLSENWPAKVKTDFLAALSDKLRYIEQMPELYRKSLKREGLRECVINKYTVLFYRIKNDEIEVVSVSSTRKGN